MLNSVCGCPIDLDYDFINEVFFHEEYEKLSVTPNELYLRQNGGCWLKLIYDEINGKKVLGDLYCTDGKEYSQTKLLLNPTNECIKCITSFFVEREKSGT